MASHRPVVLTNGELKQLPIGDTILGATGGSGATIYTGTAVIDFGPYPGSNEASVVVSGQTGIAPSTVVTLQVPYTASLDYTEADHAYIAALASFVPGSIVTDTSFTIYGRSVHKMQGRINVQWTWS
jgi:hypothetical protein